MSSYGAMHGCCHHEQPISASKLHGPLTWALGCTAAVCLIAATISLSTASPEPTQLYVGVAPATTARVATHTANGVPTATNRQPLAPAASVVGPRSGATTAPHAATAAEFTMDGRFESTVDGAVGARWLALSAAAIVGWMLSRQAYRNEHQDVAMAAVSSERRGIRKWVGNIFGKSNTDASAVAAPATPARRIQGNGLGTYVPSTSTTAGSLVMRRDRVRPNYANSYPAFMEQLNKTFPGSETEINFLAKTTQILNANGFNKDNSIVLISVCRDELTRSFIDTVEELWGPSFSIGSLAGMVFCGKTGFGAGMAHAPQCPDGIEKYVFISASHIAISEQGEIGTCFRKGREQSSGACGALQGMLGELKGGSLGVTGNTVDMEYSMMKQSMTGYVPYGRVPTLEELTKATQVCIKDQIQEILGGLDLPNAEIAFVSGVQVHGPDEENFFCPTDLYMKKLTGERIDIDVTTIHEVAATDIVESARQSDLAKVLFVIEQGNEIDVARWIEGGGDVNIQDVDGRTPLQVAAKNGHAGIVHCLLENGASPTIYCNRGRGPLQEAVQFDHDAVIEQLITYHPNLKLPRDVAEFYLWRCAREGNLKKAKLSVKYGPPGVMDCTNVDGDTPLFAAVGAHHLEVAKFLISAGAKTTHADVDGIVARRRGTDLDDLAWALYPQGLPEEEEKMVSV